MNIQTTIMNLNVFCKAPKELIGGKAIGLISLANNKIVIPKGFIINTEVFKTILHEAKLWQKYVSAIQNPEQLVILKDDFLRHCQTSLLVDTVFNLAKKECLRKKMNLVAVRSSFTQEDSQKYSYAGIFHTGLNITVVDLKKALIDCWASVFDAHNGGYCNKQKKIKTPLMAIIIQEMILGDFSGVAFSKNIITHNEREIIVEYLPGLCEQIVNGSETPKKLVLFKADLPNYVPNTLKKITPVLISQIKILERFFSASIDVEWTTLNDKLYFLQCRKVTATSIAPRYNIDWRNAQTLWLVDGSSINYCQHLSGDIQSGQVLPSNIKNSYRVYANQGYLECFVKKETVAQLQQYAYDFLSDHFFNATQKKITRTYKKIWAVFDELDSYSYRQASNQDLLQLIKKINRHLYLSVSYFKLTSEEITGVLFSQLCNVLSFQDASIMCSYPELDIMDEERIYFSKQTPKISVAHLLSYLKKYPWLVTNCYNNRQALVILKKLFSHSDNAMMPNNIYRYKQSIIAKQKKIIVNQQLDKKTISLAKKLQFLGHSRLQMKLGWAGIDFYMIKFFSELSRRFHVPIRHFHDYYFMTDIICLLETEKKLSETIIKRRKKEFLIDVTNDTLKISYNRPTLKAFKKRYFIGVGHDSEGQTSFVGQIANPGTTCGEVFVIRANDFDCLGNLKKKERYIFVCDMLQPNMINLISHHAKGIVTDEGGILSHAAIIARERKIPCIVGCGFATKALKNGDYIFLDGNKGIVSQVKQG